MKRRMLAGLALALVLAADAFAQGGGGGGGGGGNGGGGNGGGGMGGGGRGGWDNERGRGIRWVETIESAVSGSKENDRFILYYVYPVTEAKDPAPFNNQDVIAASRGNWTFVKHVLDKEDLTQKKLKITTAPTLIGMDKFSNPFPRYSAVTADTLRSVLKITPEHVEAYKRDLASDWTRAKNALEAGDEPKAIKALLEIIAPGRVGYVEIEESFKKLRELGDKRLAAIDEAAKTDAAAAIKLLEKMAAEFKDSPPGADAQLRLARADVDNEKIAEAIVRVLKLRALDDDHVKEQRDAAGKLLDEIIADGIKRIELALSLVSAGEKEQARGELKKIAAEFKGTEAAKKAAEALKSLD